MKKVSTLLALACLFGASTATAAVKPQVADVDFSKIHLTALQRQQLRTMKASAEFDAVNQTNQENYDTRNWIDPRTGNIWTFSFLKEPTPLCELIGFNDENGNPFQYSFDELPFYCVNYQVYMTDAKTNSVTTSLSFQLCWPSYYIWNQAFTYPEDAVTDENGQIPVELRNYDCVSPDDLMNSTEWCRKFIEWEGIGGTMTSDGYNWKYFTMLPNQVLGFPGIVKGQSGFTVVGKTESNTSKVEFSGYQADNSSVSYEQVIYFMSDGGSSAIIRNKPVGTARIEGFNPHTYNLPEFGDVILYNMGIGGTATYGDTDLYPEEWGPLSQLYICAGDKYIEFKMEEGQNTFDKDKITMAIPQLPEGEDLDAHANLIRGVLYAAPDYSNDPTKNPSELIYNLIEPTEKMDEELNEPYLAIAPQANTFVANGYQPSWSDEFGMQLRTFNAPDPLGDKATIAFGTKKGFQFSCNDYFGNTVSAISTGKCKYYYDPKDLTKVREFDLVGSSDFDKVETIEANEAKVVAGNGEINVTVDEDAAVAVYSIAGALVKAADVRGGNTLNVAADKGIYVVVVNGKSAKVVL